MQTNYITTSLDGLLDEDPDPDLKIGKDPLTRFFEYDGGTYRPKKLELEYKPL